MATTKDLTDQTPDPPVAVKVHDIRGERVVLGHDVAQMFGVSTKRLNEQVNRNKAKFGDDYAFRLTQDEHDDLKSQNATSSYGWGGARYPPIAFTEHGVVMAATLLKSPQAIEATRLVVRVFVASRQQAYDAKRGKVGSKGAQLGLPLEFRNSLMNKISAAIGHVLDAMINPDEVKKARAEAKGVLADGMKALKAALNKPGLDNEHKIAEIGKLMAEAENIEVETDGKRLRNEEYQLAILAKKLSLIMQAEHFIQTGNTENFLRLLSDMTAPQKQISQSK